MDEVVRGYKVFNEDWTCSPNGNTKQYTCPGKFEEDITLLFCRRGMHFCRKAADCFNYYSFNPKNKVAEVIAYGDIIESGDKCCTNKLEIVREIPWQELLTIVNTGKDCTGLCNTGDRNTGDWNTGDWNTGNWNTGCFNTKESTINLFDKPSNITYSEWLVSDARRLLNRIPKKVVEWIFEENMTDEEKQENPTYKTTGGFLKILDESESAQIWWDGLTESDKSTIKAIPNFDSKFFEIKSGRLTSDRTEKRRSGTNRVPETVERKEGEKA